MPAPLLRHVRYAQAAAATWETVVPLVPAARAFVVSKLKVVRVGGAASATISISIGPTSGSPGNVTNNLPLMTGEEYAESGYVIPAGSALFIYSDVATSVVVNVFGQEVDNV